MERETRKSYSPVQTQSSNFDLISFTFVCEIGMKSPVEREPYFRVAISPSESSTMFIVLLSLANHDVYHKS